MPKISVIMSVKDAEQYIEHAVRGILRQTYRNFEFLITDDGSGDGTWKKLEAFAQTDDRIRLYRNEHSIGLPASLNALIDNAHGEYIARMDGDDMVMEDRFAMQLEVLDSGHADFCGTWHSAFGDQREAVVKFPVENEQIKTHLLFNNAISHPTVMLRSSLLETERYAVTGEYPEDYGLWQRISLRCRMYNIPRVLLRYRRHSGQSVAKRSRDQIEGSAELAVRYLDMRGIPASLEEKQVHARIRHRDPPETWDEVASTEAWLLKLVEHFRGRPLAQRAVAEQWYRYCLKSASKGVRAYRFFCRSPLRKIGDFSPWQKRSILLLGLLKVRYGSAFYSYLAARSPASRQ